ncbi:MAG: putative lipid II flippase FtsW [Xanthomonadales bacterium]|nr:putative lipid II flippase FtsW [Gammaproteobacteria bacterium]MBT8076550.1 putative lipid II flippase FtsW [Gammaproteobacteria bacterium]NNK05295.1 putative lipid II flippase FtsW [Xanthomonadales bacterium]NNK98859.1 putative lipid II flippase FtsW [Xanthomonadales bacterium]
MRRKADQQQAQRGSRLKKAVRADSWLLVPVLLLVASGLVMVGSSSVAIAESHGVSTYYYLLRHFIYILLGVLLASTFRVIPVAFLERISRPLMWLSALVLLLVFIPGVGHSVNGSARWITLGFANFQVVEAVKIMVILYMAGYLVRKADMVKIRFFDTLKPLMLAAMLTGILLMQPDMGSAAVITAIVGGMVWLAGAAWRHIFVLGALSLPVFGFAAMEPYRLRRIVSFMNPWEDPFGGGFQLTQALIAVGRGEVFGVGLGASIQKLFYLPEAHTDFIFAVLAEEFGLVGVIFILSMFMLLVARIMIIGLMAHRAEKPFAGNVAYGIGLWIGLQALVSMGVNLGVLPTKGLTLPLISSGGSSVLMTFLALGIVFRIRYELDRDAPLKIARVPNTAGVRR